MFKWPLMRGNFHADDFRAVTDLLTSGQHWSGTTDGCWNLDARLTQGEQARAFEEEFAAWQGQRYCVLVNSGASANLITMAALAERMGVTKPHRYCALCACNGCLENHGARRKVLVPVLTWSSDIASVLHAGLEPVFVDIDQRTLGMDAARAAEALGANDGQVAAVFLTHCMGYNALTAELLALCHKSGAALIEDCCESVGARTAWAGRRHKVGTFGLASNFSFYYAHHATTIEGGAVCTDDKELYQSLRMLRGHGLVRERDDNLYGPPVPADLDPQFVFAVPGYNVRPTEIAAAIGRSQLKRLDYGIRRRNGNLAAFLANLDPEHYRTDFDVRNGHGDMTCSSYALTLVLRRPDQALAERITDLFREQGIESRRGLAGGGNQLRQPYLRRLYGDLYRKYPAAEHLHFYSFQVGNYPGLDEGEVVDLARRLNDLTVARPGVAACQAN